MGAKQLMEHNDCEDSTLGQQGLNIDMCCSQSRHEWKETCLGRHDENRRLYPSKREGENENGNFDDSLMDMLKTLNPKRKSQDSTTYHVGHYERGVKGSEVAPPGWTGAELLQLNKAVQVASTAIRSKRPDYFMIQVTSKIVLSRCYTQMQACFIFRYY